MAEKGRAAAEEEDEEDEEDVSDVDDAPLPALRRRAAASDDDEDGGGSPPPSTVVGSDSDSDGQGAAELYDEDEGSEKCEEGQEDFDTGRGGGDGVGGEAKEVADEVVLHRMMRGSTRRRTRRRGEPQWKERTKRRSSPTPCRGWVPSSCTMTASRTRKTAAADARGSFSVAKSHSVLKMIVYGCTIGLKR